VNSICRSDVPALQRASGQAAHIESKRLAPFSARHAQQARQMAADMRHNARVLSDPEPQHSDATRARLRDERGQLEDLLPAGVAPEAAPENFDDLDQLL
jgi:hypothetical protein